MDMRTVTLGLLTAAIGTCMIIVITAGKTGTKPATVASSTNPSAKSAVNGATPRRTVIQSRATSGPMAERRKKAPTNDTSVRPTTRRPITPIMPRTWIPLLRRM